MPDCHIMSQLLLFLITFLSLDSFVLLCVVSGAVDCVLVILLPLESEFSSCSCCFIFIARAV